MNFMARGEWWRLRVLDVPNHILGLMVSDIEKWIEHSGVEWTIKRLKSIKNDLIRHQCGLSPLTHIRRNKHGGLYGWIGSLFRFSEKDERSLAHAIQSLMSYTLFVSNDLTKNQWEKFISGVESDETFIPEDLFLELEKTARNWFEDYTPTKREFIDVDRILRYQGSPSKRAPRINGPSTPQDKNLEDELDVLLEPQGRSLYQKYRKSYCFTLEDLDGAKNRLGSVSQNYGVPKFDRSQLTAGNIGFIQEPGFKLRSVANPFRIHQMALRPLGDMLYSILSELPWDCTFDQSKAFPKIQKALSTCHTVHCVDLSSATDFFPLSLQLRVLREIFGKRQDIDLFEDLSRARWRTGRKDQPYVTWTRGQPMGLYPSFASFGLTHGLLLLTLAGGIYRNQFFVVGDDVIILDDKLAEAYQSCLKLLECPFSPDKTISSSNLAEFAGKIITKDSIIPQLKWRHVSDDNFIDIMKLLGSRAYCILSKRQKKVYKKISRLLPPYGCNHSNGKSLPLNEVVYLTEVMKDKYFDKTHVQDSLVDLSSWLRKHFSETGLWNYLDRGILRTISTFDEKVVAAYRNTPFYESIKRHGVSAAKGIADLPKVMDDSSLPTLVRNPSRTSTLEWYERMLGLSI